MFFFNKGYEKINQDKAKEMMDNSNPIIIDVRTPDEYRGGKIPKAINIPVNMIVKQAEARIKSKDSEVLVYCLTGSRSKLAAKMLTKLGYTNVYDFGGINSWKYKITR